MDLVLPWPPSANVAWRNYRGRMVLNPIAETYRWEVKAIVSREYRMHRAYRVPLSVDIVANPPDKRRRDLDNLLKVTLDALTHAGVWLDDSLIYRLCIVKGDLDKGTGNLDVTIRRAADD